VVETSMLKTAVTKMDVVAQMRRKHRRRRKTYVT